MSLDFKRKNPPLNTLSLLLACLHFWLHSVLYCILVIPLNKSEMMQCSIKILVQLQKEFDSKTFFHHPKMGNNHTGGIFTKQAGIIITPLTVASTAHVPFWELFKGILKTGGKHRMLQPQVEEKWVCQNIILEHFITKSLECTELSITV